MERCITSNEYNDHNYRSMVLKCTHLSVSQQDDFLQLFAKHALLVDGTLGKIPNVKVHLELKPNSKPYFARAYKISHHIPEMARKEEDELCQIGYFNQISIQNGETHLYSELKNGGVSFLTDICQINQNLILKPVYLPSIYDIL
jgi:hypothetical protein